MLTPVELLMLRVYAQCVYWYDVVLDSLRSLLDYARSLLT